MNFWQVLCSPRMLVAALMGFSCGVPLLLTLSLLQAWMRREGVDLGTIGMYALVGLPYTLKFLWAPIFDSHVLGSLGRRRGWLLAAQLLLIAAVAVLSGAEPRESPRLLALAALAVAFFSASQDIIVDAYRREDLADRELGLGASFYVNGYRVGMLLAGSGGLILADHISFRLVYLLMAASMVIGLCTTVLCREPPLAPGRPTSFQQAVLDPFVEYFRRKQALTILAFILLYKLGDQMASTMTMPFYLDLGFSTSQVGTVVKLFGFWATLAGGFLGGLLLLRLGIGVSLTIFGLLQALSTAGFALLAWAGASLPLLAAVIACENLTSGMGTAAYVAFMASSTDRRFSATQYALLSSLMGVPRVLAAAPTGYLAAWLGWPFFFLACTLCALPGLLMLPRVQLQRNIAE
ncbi:MAG: AmpG family muropeptide MFS transporter [Desulfobulbaceae bacterium A2]|nr:MAG: AmpG family muropeptide MFS transporter [Desulfobulbaceae bacterium A2]